MNLNYIILAHKNPQQLKRLVEKLNTPDTFFYIHVDKNFKVEPFITSLLTIKNVFFLEMREKCAWGDIAIVKATITALEQIIKDKRTGYCILLSGQDYPLKTNQQIQLFFTRNYGTNFIDTFSIPNEDWEYSGLRRIQHYKFNLSEKKSHYILLPSIFSKDFFQKFKRNIKRVLRLLKHRNFAVIRIFQKRDFPGYIKPFGGSQWWAIPVETATKILLFLKQHKDYLAYHKYTLMADEIFFHSIVKHISLIENDRIIKPSLTHVNWEWRGVSRPVTFNSGDVEELMNQHEDTLVARKFDINIDHTILDLIDNLHNQSSLRG
jgi:hypothetical protein